MTGLIGFSSGYYAMLDCEVLLMLGTDFPSRQFYPQGADVRRAQVDIRAENTGRHVAVDLGLIGDIEASLGTWTGSSCRPRSHWGRRRGSLFTW
jgi:pyruvate dehydrogenase (quinone)